jgi:acyl dehydratase
MSEYNTKNDDRMDEFVKRTKALIGEPITEGSPWNTAVGKDQAIQFVNGLGDINPRWTPSGPSSEVHPTYLTSVRYPQLHGEEMSVPMSSFVSDIEYQWHGPVTLGDEINPTAIIDDVFEKNRNDRRYVFITSNTEYKVNNTVVAEASATQIFVSDTDSNLEDHEIYEYDENELKDIKRAYESELDRLSSIPKTPDPECLTVGDVLPSIIRGPLTIADMVCWQSAVPPTYGSTIINYQQRKDAPYNTVTNPVTGWIQKSSHQHEDPWLCEQRGMPLPFANGVNLYAWTTIPMTNWIGEEGELRQHKGHIKKPLFYGDTLSVEAMITDTQVSDEELTVGLEWNATNQLDELILEGDSEVALPVNSG